jgi:hypothetical protein
VPGVGIWKRVVSGLTRAVGVGAAAGVTSDLSGLGPEEAIVVGGVTAAAAGAREAAGAIRRSPTAGALAVREEMREWLVGLRISLDGAAEQPASFEEVLTTFVGEADMQKDEALKAALIRVRGTMRTRRDFGLTSGTDELASAIDHAIRLTELPEPTVSWKPDTWFRAFR